MRETDVSIIPKTLKKMKVLATSLILGLSFILADLTCLCYGALQVGFYRGKCGIADVEAIVAGVVTGRFIRDPAIVASLLRLQFHDCFVNGCDASILIDGTNSEKTATLNLNVRGYDIIDEAKAAVDNACPGLVSCADIIVIASRDAVFLSGGGRYEVQTGRRDGSVSLARNVNLPVPSMSVSEAIVAFAQKGLTAADMILLLGSHSVGVAHCSFFKDRLYNFRNTGRPDPTMDASLAKTLRITCPQDETLNNTVNLDQFPLDPFLLDNSYYKQLVLHRGILQIDQELALDPKTKAMVTTLANGFDFPARFGVAMVKLGAIGVLTGGQGEIRTSCRAINVHPT
ncbi:hypothetical protein F0562_031459 [Nyssa sinensis]|uniref:Peroxidase n=1 Tax=Nyssa sinensis TaxID=561372 RepID=A0A5J5AVZ2_9ASTE|nr:hypothetical protein F0562_031459 [Nyssa sinensis]